MPYAKVLDKLVADTAKAQNTDYLASDFQVVRSSSAVRIAIVTQASGHVFKLVPSSGTSFSLNGGSALPQAAYFAEDVVLDTDRTWNLQDSSSGGSTVSMVVVQELSEIV